MKRYACGLLEIVKKKYQLPSWIFIEQFRDDTGFNALRSADGLAVGMYRSRGQELIGFEVKRSRADWLRELRDPNKAECVARFCDRWYIVVPKGEQEIVKPEELPPWGLIVVGDKRAEYEKEAAKLQPAPIERFFLAAIVKQAIDAVKPPPEQAAELRRHRAWQEGYDAAKVAVASAAHVNEKLAEEVAAFEAASGIRIATYHGGKELGEAVKLVQSSAHWKKRCSRELATLKWTVDRLGAALNEEITRLDSPGEAVLA